MDGYGSQDAAGRGKGERELLIGRLEALLVCELDLRHGDDEQSIYEYACTSLGPAFLRISADELSCAVGSAMQRQARAQVSACTGGCINANDLQEVTIHSVK